MPAVIPESTTERNRFEEAQLRREARLRHAAELKELRARRR